MADDAVPADVMDRAKLIAFGVCGCAPGRRRANGTSHHDSCHEHASKIAKAIMAERSRLETLLKDPGFVRANWQRGGINAEFIISEGHRGNVRLLERAAEALSPVAAWVFNDNGDLTISRGSLPYEFIERAYFAHRELSRVLAKDTADTEV